MAEDVARVLDAPEAGLSAGVSHRPDPGEGWLEVLVSGLTFDVRGLSPGLAAQPPPAQHLYGLKHPPVGEAVELVPSGHIAAGAGLPPVVRTLAGLAAGLALQLPALAVGWQPAGTLMAPGYFARIVLEWLAGGAFPALGLTALVPGEDGSIASRGLSHFIGQEFRLEGRSGEPTAEAVKLAIRVTDDLVRHGPPSAPRTIRTGEESLLAEPSQVGHLVWIWREGR